MDRVVVLWALVAAVLLSTAEGYMSKEQVKKVMKPVRSMCLPKSGVSKEAVTNINEGVFDDDDRKLKCYLACVFTMLQALKNNKISIAVVKSQVSKMLAPEVGARVVAAYESCQDATGEDSCELAYNLAKCIYEADKEVFMVP